MADTPVKRQQQVNQTVELLWQGLTNLMATTPYDQITISALTQEAGVARRTFYRHYQSIDDLLVNKINQLVIKLYQDAQVDADDFEELIRHIFYFFKPYQKFLRVLRDNHKLYLVQSSILEYRDQSLVHLSDNDQNQLIYYFGAGGISNIITYWIKTDFQASPTEVEEMAHQLIKHLHHLVDTDEK
ncbi:TetR/AcrR family transcriptional regulator [Fructobacillus ficulneus]|uniref:HTH tetR-type domain-containing protein n=1 Tax=Fructobacillus ficulneus TaxID=157463 RepID=A0A0K8MGD3_9LACO|nr:TetR/AcrR family transcriptional regulator [Fructobacillus ficulneus]GAO99585.1 hypothetical protein FFIC_230690 [Fructobacillus ficulneus]